MELDLDNLRAVRLLGKGAMGTVFLIRPPKSSSAPPFALKVVEKRSAAPDTTRRSRWELTVLSGLSHPFLPCLLGRLETPDFLAYALPFCPGGHLLSLRLSLPDHVFSAAALLFYSSELVLALHHLHSLGIAYRDLKPENILLQPSGHLTLTDFDLSRHLTRRPHKSPEHHQTDPQNPTGSTPGRRNRHRRNGMLFFRKAKSVRVSPVGRRNASAAAATSGERSMSFVGTEEYVAPEVVRGDGHEFAVDWWALGVVMYEMAYGATPFRGRNRKETFRNILYRPVEFAGKRKTDLTDLLERLLEKDPSRRLGFRGGAEEVKSHPFFGGVRWELLAEVARPPFLPPVEEDEDEEVTGFDVRDYFRKEKEREELMTPSESPSSISVSLTEF